MLTMNVKLGSQLDVLGVNECVMMMMIRNAENAMRLGH